MDHRLLSLLVFAVWGAAAAAFIYALVRSVGYLSALRTCLAWAALIVGFMLFNYWLANHLDLSRSSSGFARGKQVISPFGFLVQLLLIIEIVVAVVIKRAIRRSTNAAPDPRGLKQSVTKELSTPGIASPPVLESKSASLRDEHTFAPNISSFVFLCCSMGNFWLAVEALQRSVYGLVFVVLGLGLLVVACRAGFVHQFRRK